MEIRTLRDSELDQAFDLDADAFHAPEERREFFRRFVDPARVIGAFEGDRLIAMTGFIQFGQFFGGRSVPMGGLSSVAVVPDARGGGLAKQVIRSCMEAMRERGEVISSLSPATTSLYRSLGWEVAGNYTIRKVEPRSLHGLPRPGSGRMRPRREDDWDSIRACYTRLASSSNGCLDRPDHWWERRRFQWKDRHAYVFEEAEEEVAGYLVYRQVDGELNRFGGDFDIAVDEIVSTTRDAGLGLWGLLASWASQAAQVVFHGPADDPIQLVLPEQVFQTLAEIRWMTRVVDAEGAIGARGFPAGLDVEVPLQLRDPELPANEGGFTLTVQKARGQLAAAASGGGPCLDVNGFSSLYTGWATTAALERAGLLTGGSPAERAALDAAFGGATPWMLDEF
jgi:predicted acetyltransferase